MVIIKEDGLYCTKIKVYGPIYSAWKIDEMESFGKADYSEWNF